MFAAAFFAYVAALAPGFYWLDSSELAAAAWTLGIAHPPGHPLPSLLGRALSLLPLGTVAFRVGLASALCGAGAAVQTARLGRLVARRTRGASAPSRLDSAWGAAAGLLFAGSYAAAFSAVRPEVYALSALLVLTAAYELCLYDEGGDPRRLLTSALFAGLALSNHHLLALTFAGPAALLFAPRVRWRQALWALAVALVALVALWAYLPIRGARHPLIDWGAPTTLDRFFWTVSAKAFQKAVARGQLSDLLAVSEALAAQLWLVGLFAALGGAYLLIRLRRWRLALLLLGAALCDAVTPALVGFDPANPDAYGYLEAAVALLAALGCALPAALATVRPRLMGALSVGLLGSVFFAGVTSSQRWRRTDFWDSGATLRPFLDAAPPRALVVTSDFQTIFGLWYLTAVEGYRPDLEIVHRHYLAYPGYRDEVLRRAPQLAPLLGSHDLVTARVVAYEPKWIEYSLDLPPALRVSAGNIDVPVGLDEPQTLRFAAWQAFLAAHRACHLAPDRAAPLVARAATLLHMPWLNCDHVDDPVTLRSP